MLAKVLLFPCLLACSVTASFENVLQNDILAAMSWALLDISPLSYAPVDISYNETVALEEEMKKMATTKKAIPAEETEKKGNNKDRQGRQFFTFQGTRPTLGVSIRPFSSKLFEVYGGNSVGIYVGLGNKVTLDNILNLKQRRSFGDSDDLLAGLEDIVGMLGVDGKACVHRLLCDMGSMPAFQDAGLLGEMTEITIRFLLSEQYSDLSDLAMTENSIARSAKHSMHYMDAVGQGRRGADCGAIYDSCPVSLFRLVQSFRENNS